MSKSGTASITARRIALIVVLLLIWEASGLWLFDVFWTSRPSLIGARLWALATSGDLLRHAWSTMMEAGLGLGLGILLGVPLGMAMAHFKRAAETAEPVVMGLYSLPRVALAPLFVLWFGIGLFSKVMMACSMVVFVFILNVAEGIRNVDRDLLDLMRTMRAPPFYVVRKVLLPAVLPWIVASLRIGIGLSLIGAVVGELVGANRGLGWYVERAGGQLDTTGVFTGLVALMAIAMAANQLVALLEARVTAWRR